ncbi:armadillo-type protein [Fimicolochytrium jonesii]|uniref:armadillo-type protein n=1 Tax=Fimicolochytrium jonesii TaxID=1396493 RepID=UPI0022FE4BED|nr:armadillo-type protein [Fimicolochytrium jonesii]KAI8817434.1 armadillo-type protein [Fimicolochytrium jonesii]
MDLQAICAHFEQTCADFQVPDRRIQAEKNMVQFRSTPNLLPVCKYILEHTEKPDVKFHVLLSLKESAAREYALHPRQEIHALREWLLNYAITRFDHLPTYVRNSVLYPIAVIVKRGSLEESAEEKQAFLSRVTDLLNGDKKQSQIALCLFAALLDEFSSTRASAVGLPYDFHVKSRQLFEEGELRHIFQVVYHVLQHFMNTKEYLQDALSSELLITAMSVAQKAVDWEFLTPEENALSGSFRTNQEERRTSQPGYFPASWKEFIVRPDVIDLFFQLNSTFRDEGRLGDSARHCLTDLAAVHGPVFHVADPNGHVIKDQAGRVLEDTNALRAYIGHFLKRFLTVLTDFLPRFDSEVEMGLASELICITSVCKRIIFTHPLRVIAGVPEFLPFLHELGTLTIKCYRRTGCDDEDWSSCTQEEGDDLLDVWADLVEKAEIYTEEQTALQSTGAKAGNDFDFPNFMKFLTDVAFHVFDAYVEMRLEVAKQAVEDDADDDMVKDEYMYEEQLVSAAIIGRLDPRKPLEKLQALVDDRLGRIRKVFEGAEHADDLAWLQEHLHWLALFSGHLLAYGGTGEKREIPRSLLALSMASAENADPVVKLALTLLYALDVVSVNPNSPSFSLCSPLLCETLLWFIERWSQTYLFLPAEELHTHSLMRAFGRDGGGPAVLDGIMNMLEKNFDMWPGQEDLLMQIVSLLSTFSKVPGIRNALVLSDRFQKLIVFFLGSLSKLTATVHSPLIENIAIIATHASDPEIRARYFHSISNAIDTRLLSIIQNPTFVQSHQTPDTIELVISTMEMYSGLALAADEANTKQVFTAVAKHFDVFVQLLELYRNTTEVEKYILQVFANLIRCQSFEELTPEDCERLYSSVLSVLQTYAKNTVGRKRSVNTGEEDEMFEDLSCILDILSQLMASQYEGITWAEILEKRKAKGGTDVADVIFYGINVVIPLITDDMLKFPELCRDYISLISHLIRYFPDRLPVLPPPLLAGLVRSLESGMHNPMIEVARSAFEAITSLALFVWDEPAHGGVSMEFLHPHLNKFLQKTLEMFLFLEFDAGLMEAAGEALFALVVARGAFYDLLTQHLLAQQTSAALAQRLRNALSLLNAGISETARDQAAGGILRVARLEGCIATAGGRLWLTAYRKRLEAFLVNVRGFLRVK